MPISKTLIVTLSTAVLGLSACTSTVHKVAPLGSVKTLSIDAKQRLVLTSEKGGYYRNETVTCAEPSPDALVAQAAALSGNLTTPQSVGAVLGASNTEAAGSIGLRTQTIQILRDGYYRICEAYQNGALTKQDYQKVLGGVDVFIAVVAAIETIGGTTRAPAIGLTPGQASTSASGTEAKAETTVGKVEIETVKQADGTMSKEQADAIAEIVAGYMNYKLKVGNR